MIEVMNGVDTKTPYEWSPGMPVYVDDATGKGVVTHSMIASFRQCPQNFNYKYVQRLKPKILGRPLRFGSWMHLLYEAYHKGEDWKAIHQRETLKFSKLFEEEQAWIGDLPRECYHTMLSYIWHYKYDEWKVHEVEFTLEAELPNGYLYRGRIDLLIENQFGLWIVDHKNVRSMPDADYRIKDAQSALYIWAALKNKIKVQGHIWNYIRSRPPSVPQLLQSGKALSRSKKIVSDYPTMMRALKKYGLDPDDYDDKLSYLASQRYQPGMLQTSPFFRREILEKSPELLKYVATAGYTTAKEINNYHWDQQHRVVRNTGSHCQYRCSYCDLCTAELFGGNSVIIRSKNFTVGDPLDYYMDNESKDSNAGD